MTSTRRRSRATARALVAVLAAALSVALVGIPAGAAGEGTVGIGLLEAPADRADDPRALVYVVDHVQPGDVIERRIEVTNTTSQRLEIDLYPAAATIAGDGWKPLDGRTQNELSSWTSMGPDRVVVDPGSAAPATLRIAVPDDATPGEHYAVAWAELPSTTSGAVELVHRVGIRIYLSVGDGTEPVTDFAIRSATAATNTDGSRSLDVEIENTGGRAVDVGGEVRLGDGPGGTTAGPFAAPAGPTVAPGESGVVRMPVPADLPGGTWTAEIELRSGTRIRSATFPISWSDPDASVAVLQLPKAGGGEAAPPSESAGLAPDTSAAGLLALVMIVAVGAAMGLYARKRPRSA